MRFALLAALLLLFLGACSDAKFAKLAAKLKSKSSAKDSGSSEGEEKGGGPEEYAEAMNIIAENINKAAEKSEALVNEHMANVDKDPGSLITKEAMKSMVEANSFLPQKAGTKSILLQPGQGFNGFTDYQPSGWKVSETMSGPAEKEKEESEEEEKGVFSYPFGLGPVLMNQCTERNYSKTSPCYNSKLFDIEDTGCGNMMDTAGFIGVGFDGRGYYSADSRKTSLVQRVCANDALYLGKEVPDIMRVFGIYHTVAETKSFQSVDQYMKFIRHQAGLSNQKGLFTSEASKYSKASSFGANLGAIGSIVGAGIGAVVGGGAGAAMGAALGGAIGGSIGGGSGSGSGSSSSKEDAEAKSNVQQSASVNQHQGATQNFFAIMYVNIVLYEITLDEVKPTDLTLSLLKDYMDLPPSYFSVGSDVKYQGFLLRWGTHFIRSGKFGGQLKVTKTCKTSQQLSSQEFARVSETEFKSMFSTLQSSYTQKSSSWSALGFGGKKKSAEQKDTAKAESEYQSQLEQENKQQQKMRQSEFTQTSVEAQGGTPEIAEALMDFYTPAFKQLFHDWLVSIKDYPKPFEFQLKSIHTLFDMRMDELFTSGDHNFGCTGAKTDIHTEAGTRKRFYLETRVVKKGKKTVEEQIKVYCKYKNREDFKEDLERRRISLERAVGIYIVEGPFPTSSAELPAGETGCEESTLAELNLNATATDVLKFSELKSKPFILAFDLQAPIPEITGKESKFRMIYRAGRWFASDPEASHMHLYDGCMVAASNETRICFKNIILSYDESGGFFYIKPLDLVQSQRVMPTLPGWLAGVTVGRPKRILTTEALRRSVHNKEVSVPCHVKWLNSHRLDPHKNENCLHFTAATEGDIFVIFASIPKDHNTWYYLQISPYGASFYEGMQLRKRDVGVGMGVLGNRNLFQSFFVCVSQKKDSVIMQYGKSEPDSEVGKVYSGYKFPAHKRFSRLSFYSFGSGQKPVSLMDIRLTKEMPEVDCLNDDYTKVDGHCVPICHSECNGCSRARDSTACHQCKNVRVEKGEGIRKIIECLAECPPAMSKAADKEKLCVPCAAGMFKDKKGNEKCTKCSPGSFSAEGAEKCTPCSSGMFNDKEGQVSCQKCAAGTFSRSGASKCDNCHSGTFSESGKSHCDPCPYGHYGDTNGLTKCKPCASGYFNDKRGQTTCQKCPHGTSSATGSKSCANSCPMGQFSPAKGVPCSKCPPGAYTESAGSTSCSKCKPGSYQPNWGQSACISAPKGSYVSESTAKAAQKCPAGTFNDKEGQTSRSICAQCPAGSYANEGAASCTKCPKGLYQRSSGQSSCLRASPGHYVDGVGHSGQKQCRAGTYAPGSGSAACSLCPKGHFTSGVGSVSCQQCPAGKYAPSTGLTGCLPCPAGRYSSASGSQSCSVCAAGQYSASGATRCTDCPPGRYASSTGSSTCSLCPVGRYSMTKKSSVCNACLVGYYTASAGSSKCSRCLPGSYAPKIASTGCTRCSAGHFAINFGAASCQPCPAGQFASSSGAASCSRCAAGTYASSSGSRGCTTCPAGQYSAAGATKCSGCTAGTYAGIGSSSCTSCPTLQYSKAGATGCVKCPAFSLDNYKSYCYQRAYFASCRQSSTYYFKGYSPHPCEKAMDNSRNRYAGGGTECSHTNRWTSGVANEYWSATFKNPGNLRVLVLWSRLMYNNESWEIRIDVSDGKKWHSCGTIKESYTIRQVNCHVDGAKEVKITKNIHDYLTLCEVEAYFEGTKKA